MAALPRWYLSGGSGNAVASFSLGGGISATQAGQNLFDDISGDESLAGESEYRGVYVKNDGDVDLQSTFVWVQSNTPDPDTAISIALAVEGVNMTMATIPNENTPPVGPVFSAPSSKPVGLNMGTIPPGQRFGLWVRRTVNPNAAAYNADQFTLRVEGDTGA
jgi:hypothetical protein